MSTFKKIGDVFCQWPSKPVALIELIGGSYISIKPEITYKRLISRLFQRQIAIHTWSYVPSFDHQIQANQAWKQFRLSRKIFEESIGLIHKPIRIGHSLGCKLHLLSPDGGRNCNGFIAISFNNFNATKSIPMLKEISNKLRFQTEFSPSPKETLNLINEHYEQRNNLLITFKDDNLDQNDILIKYLRKRTHDKSRLIKLNGNHLTPVSMGIREKIRSSKLQNPTKYNSIEYIVNQICKWEV